MTLETPSDRSPSRLRSGFDRAWVPRLGPEAASHLARLALLAVTLGPVVVVLSVVASLAVRTGHPADLALAAAALVAVLGLCLGWVRLSAHFAVAVSEHFGQEIGWRELPRFNPRLFDQWVEKRGLHPVAR